MNELSFTGITILLVLLLALGTSAVAARVLLRLIYLSARLNGSDYFLVAGWICCFGWVVTSILAMQYGYTALVENNPDVSVGVAAKKALFASNFFIDIGFYGPKGSLICLYYTLFQPDHRIERYALHATTVFVVMACIATTFSDIFTCHNVSDNWSDDPDACSTYFSLPSFITNYSLNAATDILVFCLPLSLLRRLKVDRKFKLALAGTFLLGFITIAISMFRFIWCTIDDVYAPDTILLCTAEFTTALIVVCIPILRTVYLRHKKKSENGGAAVNNNYRINTALQNMAQWSESTQVGGGGDELPTAPS